MKKKKSQKSQLGSCKETAFSEEGRISSLMKGLFTKMRQGQGHKRQRLQSVDILGGQGYDGGQLQVGARWREEDDQGRHQSAAARQRLEGAECSRQGVCAEIGA